MAAAASRVGTHTAAQTLRWADELDSELVWLPKQRSELNAMHQLWKELKRLIAANRQAAHIEALAAEAADWVLTLSTRDAMRKASLLSPNFWVRDV